MGKWRTDYEGDEPQLGSGAFFAERSDAELREIVQEHLPNQRMYEGAKDELAQRAAKRQNRLLWITLTVATATLVATVCSVVLSAS